MRKWTEGQTQADKALLRYGQLQKDMDFYLERISRLEDDTIRITQRLDGGMVRTWDEKKGEFTEVSLGGIQHTPNPNRATNKMASYLDQKMELEQCFVEARTECIQIENDLERALADDYPDEHKCLHYYYLHRLTLEEVGDVMYLSDSTISRLRKRGLTLYYEWMMEKSRR